MAANGQFTITIKGQAELSAKLNAVIIKLDNLMPEFRQIGELLTKFFSTEPFISAGSVYGQQWQPLSEEYKKEKERKYPGKGILVRTGTMMNSFAAEVTPMRVEISNTAEYFAKHQTGDGVPQRIIMMLDQQRANLAIETARKSLTQRIEALW